MSQERKWHERTRNQVLLFAVVIVLFIIVLWIALDWYIAPEKPVQRKDLAQALGLITAAVVGAVGIYFTWRGQRLSQQAQANNQKTTQAQLDNAQKELNITRRGQITERFTRAIDQLGATEDDEKKLEVRLGGIYSLERTAFEDQDYHLSIMEVLTTYVRKHASTKPKEETDKESDLEPDIQAILTVLGRRSDVHKEVEYDAIGSINLSGTDLRKVNLWKAKLQGVYLPEADLQKAYLSNADLSNANLQRADLWKADLHEAVLQGTDLREAKLQEAILQGVNLQGANLQGADLRKADLSVHVRAHKSTKQNIKTTKLSGADLSGANLSGANLDLADLSDANLSGANLKEAGLTDADLSGAELSGADLLGAYKLTADEPRQIITNEELEQQAESLEGATMPDGQKYEDWLKDK